MRPMWDYELFSFTGTAMAVNAQLQMPQRLLRTPSGDTVKYKGVTGHRFALNKFHQFLYGRTFILVVDHKSLIALFGPTKVTPALAANRLAQWALMLRQYQYSIEYRKTSDHSNAGALSRLPVGPMPILMARKMCRC